MPAQANNNHRAAIYVRVATYEQLGKPITALYCRTATRNDMGIAVQKDLLTRHSDTNGYGYCETFIDNGEGGTDTNRPAFQEMLRGIVSGYIKRVVTSDLSRLSRNTVLSDELLALFKKHGVELVSVKDVFSSFDENENNLLLSLPSVLSGIRAGYNV